MNEQSEPRLEKQIGYPPFDIWVQHGVLAAVSGGADSTAMLHCLARNFQKENQTAKLAVAHINHKLRGKDSDDDAAFVRQLAERYNLAYYEYSITETDWNNAKTGSKEGDARSIRQKFLVETAEKIGFRYVATAHNADDQAETVLHRLIRGTGIKGLAGIRQFRQINDAITLIRPLLFCTREYILKYLQQINSEYRTDSTNIENEFTRNKIRNILLPLLRSEFNSEIGTSLCRLSEIAGETEDVISELTDEVLEQVIISEQKDEIVLDTDKLRTFSTPVIREVFVRIWLKYKLPQLGMEFLRWNEITAFFENGEVGKQRQFYGGVVAEHRSCRKSNFSLRTFVIRRITHGG
jgi:tRNA(Ile)-lysidine synthase